MFFFSSKVIFVSLHIRDHTTLPRPTCDERCPQLFRSNFFELEIFERPRSSLSLQRQSARRNAVGETPSGTGYHPRGCTPDTRVSFCQLKTSERRLVRREDKHLSVRRIEPAWAEAVLRCVLRSLNVFLGGKPCRGRPLWSWPCGECRSRLPETVRIRSLPSDPPILPASKCVSW